MNDASGTQKCTASIDGAWTREFRKRLLDWFDRVQRDLPWRRSQDPYHIWLSEVMLQQTQVDTVIPYYERFLSRWPTLSDLAKAEDGEVLRAWEGLGYYRRARHLASAVREVEEKYGGEVPGDYKRFRALPGVGDYTAGAVLSIAFNEPFPAVDGNVMRVISRLFGIRESIDKSTTRREIQSIAGILVPEDRPGDFNQAVMELGALVCRPRQAVCEDCPVARMCVARTEGIAHELPVRDQRRPPTPVRVVCGVIANEEGELWLEQRPTDGLLGGLWQFPTREMKVDECPVKALAKVAGEATFDEAPFLELTHTFTHLRWHMLVFKGKVSKEVPGANWHTLRAINERPLTRAHRKVYDAIAPDFESR